MFFEVSLHWWEQTQKITVGNQTIIAVTLTTGKALEDVVVVGYGTQKKKDLTGEVLNGVAAKYHDDARKLKIVKSEPNITLLLNHRVMGVEKEGDIITSLIVQSTLNSRQFKLKGKLFADCIGDAAIGFKAGADYEYKAENLMGSSNLFNVLDTAQTRKRC